MQVSVRDNNVDQALRALKKKLQREGVFREMKLKQHFEKPSEKKARQKAKQAAARAQVDGSEAAEGTDRSTGRHGAQLEEDLDEEVSMFEQLLREGSASGVDRAREHHRAVIG